MQRMTLNDQQWLVVITQWLRMIKNDEFVTDSLFLVTITPSSINFRGFDCRGWQTLHHKLANNTKSVIIIIYYKNIKSKCIFLYQKNHVCTMKNMWQKDKQNISNMFMLRINFGNSANVIILIYIYSIILTHIQYPAGVELASALPSIYVR